jgi:hypothetical protein
VFFKAIRIQKIDTKGTSGSCKGVMSSTNPLMTRGSTSLVSGQSCDKFYELTVPSYFSSVIISRCGVCMIEWCESKCSNQADSVLPVVSK